MFIFFGSPRFADIILKQLIENGHAPVAVVCNPDKPYGRKKIMTPPPVKLLAQKHHIPVLQFEKISMADAADLPHAQYAIIAAYAHIIPRSIIDAFPKGVIGVHPSLLPLYRGASPIQSALLDGISRTGVSLYRMDEKMDHGPILAQKEVTIDENDAYTSLEETLARTAGDMITEIMPLYLAGTMEAKEQDHARATFTKKFTTEDGRVDMEKDAPETIFRKIKALSPDPGVFTFIDSKRVKLLEAQKNSDGTYVVTKILPEGKKEQKANLHIPQG